jgi:hypothetical protein
MARELTSDEIKAYLKELRALSNQAKYDSA